MAMTDLTRRDGESEFAYHKRLVCGKLVDKTLSDCDYAELSNFVYGQPYSSDMTRRMMYGSKKTLELLEKEREDQFAQTGIIGELESKKAELQQERQKFFDQRREYAKILSANARQDHLYDRLVNAAESLDNTVGSMYESAGDVQISHSDKEAVLVFSDWHYGMVTQNVFNTYNTEICKERVKTVVENAISRIILNGCQRLHIIVLGDLFHGAIHVSARVASEELVCDQLMQVSEILAQSIYKLSACVQETHVYMTYGNHGRTVQKKQDNIHRDNIERIIPWWLEQRFQKCSDRIIVHPESDTEFLLLDVCGHSILASHGDLDVARMSPRLLGPVFQKVYGRDVEYMILGDKHHRESYSELGVTATICDSLCGTDDYANEKRLYSEPRQLLLIVSQRDGVDAEYRLRCEVQ